MRVRRITVSCIVDVAITDDEVISRVTGPGGDEWRDNICDGIRTEDDVFRHLAYNAVAGGAGHANELDGWADLPNTAAYMNVREVTVDDPLRAASPPPGEG